MKPVRILIYALLVGVFGVASAYAQALDCPALFRAAVAAAAEHCAGLERNQACLASGSATLVPTADHAGASFAQPGDRIDAAAIDSLTQTGGASWALTVMRLQLNQADTAPEHNSVVFVMGDVSLQQQLPDPTVVEEDGELAEMQDQINETLGEDGVPSPMQAFNLTTAAEQACGDELPHGVIVQSPNLTPADEGYLPTQLWINGWSFSLGSTVLVNAETDGSAAVEVLEHYATVAGEDGDVTVLVGQGIDLPPGTPYVGNEDGTVVVAPRPTPEAAEDGSLFDGLLDELFGEEEEQIANRPPRRSNNSGKLEALTDDDQIAPAGIWRFDMNSESSAGDCVMNIWAGQLQEVDYIELTDMIHLDPAGYPSGLSFFGMDYSLSASQSFTFGRTASDHYVARKWPLGDMVYEQFNIDRITPFYISGRFTGIVRGSGSHYCLHIVTFSLESCLMDVIYDETDGRGICPAEIHQAMGTN
ncbi:MAG: hypothetical protein IT320_11790 [Anaerolineae bacterium]|nr:hypothetical protein [Anaerolineae bacterium]